MDRLIAEQQFSQAVDEIARVSAGHSDYAQLREKLKIIDEQANGYAQDVIQETQTLKTQFKWQQAKQRLSEALDRLPKKLAARDAVENEYTLLLKERDSYIDKQRLRLNVALGRYLLKEGKYLERIHQANPSSLAASWEFSGYKRKRREIGRFLARSGMQALHDKRYYSARRYLKLSQQLLPDKQTQIMLESANEKIAAIKTLKKQEREDQYQRLLNQYKMLRSAEDYSVAREVLNTLLEFKPESRQLLAEQASLDSDISLTVNQAVLDGEARYSSGEVGEALIIWQQAADLAPGNTDLQQRIERAERFLENYQLLQKSNGIPK